MTPTSDQIPKPGEIYEIDFGGRARLAVVVSCSTANALRKSVVVCELLEDHLGAFGRNPLPTVVPAPSRSTGMDKDCVLSAAPYTIPRAQLKNVRGFLPPPILADLNTALKRVFGWAAWP